MNMHTEVAMSEPITSVVLAGRGLLRWPGGEERVKYRVTIRLDNTVIRVWVGEPVPAILHRASPRPHFLAYA